MMDESCVIDYGVWGMGSWGMGLWGMGYGSWVMGSWVMGHGSWVMVLWINGLWIMDNRGGEAEDECCVCDEDGELLCMIELKRCEDKERMGNDTVREYDQANVEDNNREQIEERDTIPQQRSHVVI